jgi:hypothetical protein
MADDIEYSGSELHHLRRDARDAHSSSQLAKWLSILAMIAAAIALWVAVSALNKAGDAQSTANRATESVNQAH